MEERTESWISDWRESFRSFALRAITPSWFYRRREMNSRVGDPRGDLGSPLGNPHRFVDFSQSAKVLSEPGISGEPQ